jgi:Ni2+-binding GTPase involved in maturation of urease and hydrogenase
MNRINKLPKDKKHSVSVEERVSVSVSASVCVCVIIHENGQNHPRKVSGVAQAVDVVTVNDRSEH